MTLRLRRAAPLCATLALAATLAACASEQPRTNAAVDAMRARVAQAEQNQIERESAPNALHQAEQSLAAADQAARADDGAELNHQLYLSDRSLLTAEAITQARTARNQMAQLGQEREQAVNAAREKELQAYQTRQTSQGTVISLYDLAFGTGSATLMPAAAQRLQPLADYLRAHPDRQVIVEGNTDSKGSPDSNLVLSQRRADAVRDYLLTSGVAPERVIARGLGESMPLASNNTPTGRQQNRRVDVVIQAQQTAGLPPPPTPRSALPPD